MRLREHEQSKERWSLLRNLLTSSLPLPASEQSFVLVPVSSAYNDTSESRWELQNVFPYSKLLLSIYYEMSPPKRWGSSRVSNSKANGGEGEAMGNDTGLRRHFSNITRIARRNTNNNGGNRQRDLNEDWRPQTADPTGAGSTGVSSVGERELTPEAPASARADTESETPGSPSTPLKKGSPWSRFKAKLRESPKQKSPSRDFREDSPEYAEPIDEYEMARSRAGSIAIPQTLAEQEVEPELVPTAEFVDTYTPNSLGESRDADDDEVIEFWFPQATATRMATMNPPSNDVHLYPGVATQLVGSEGVEIINNCEAKFTQKTLQRVDDSDPFIDRTIGVWADRRKVDHKIVRPGDIIRAIHSVAQNDLYQPYPSSEVRIFGHGPVFSKVRPFVVLYKTAEGMLCLPLFSCQFLKVGGVSAPTVKEYMSICTEKSGKGNKWKGFTPVNGKPLSMVVYPGQRMKSESFVGIAKPVNISRSEAVKYKQARLMPESYVRLVEAYTFRQHERLLYAYHEVNLKYPGGIASPKDINQEWPAHAISNAKSRYTGKVGLTAADVKDSFTVNR